MRLTQEQISIIKDNQAESIRIQQLTEAQLELAYANQWFNIWVPKVYGGAEFSFQEGLELLEDLAYQDGGLSWTVTLCSGANMFAGFIQEHIAKDVFAKRNVCLGGSGRVAGKAVWNGEYFEITGQWQYATGAPHLTHFTLNAFIFDDDKQRIDEEGNPVFLSFFVPRDQILIHYDWNTFGLECTASHSFSIEKVKIDAAYAFELKPERRNYDNALYRIPFMTFAEMTLLVNYMGMYRRFLDLIEKYFFDKSKDVFWAEKYSKQRFKLVDGFQLELEKNRLQIKTWTAAVWDSASKNNLENNDLLINEIAAGSREIVASMRRAVITLFPLIGIRGAQRENELNIVFRNIFTATQHSLLNVER